MTYFTDKYINCPCGCGATLNKETQVKLDRLRELFGQPIYVDQAATCRNYSVGVVGRKETSTHIDHGSGACSVDIKRLTFKSKADYFRLVSIAIEVGFYGFGQGSYWLGSGTDKRLHIDTRLSQVGDIRSWVY